MLMHAGLVRDLLVRARRITAPTARQGGSCHHEPDHLERNAHDRLGPALISVTPHVASQSNARAAREPAGNLLLKTCNTTGCPRRRTPLIEASYSAQAPPTRCGAQAGRDRR